MYNNISKIYLVPLLFLYYNLKTHVFLIQTLCKFSLKQKSVRFIGVKDISAFQNLLPCTFYCHYAALLRFTMRLLRPESTGKVNYDITQNNKSSKMLIKNIISDCYWYENIKPH